MNRQKSESLPFTGIVDDTGIDYFSPATSENMYMAFLRARSNQHRNAKAFYVHIPEDAEIAIMACIKEGEFIMAKLIVESLDDIKYVR